VILLDANLLVYARVSSLPHHEQTRQWLDAKLNGSARVGLPWVSILAFLRLVTNPRVFEKPETIHSAWKQVESWLDCPPVWIPEPTENHRDVLASLLAQLGGGPNLIPDAHLAALAIEHGLELCSADGDFARFSGLKWVNPLDTRR
jgi:toxin-antitoxin system PIN domain toxin